MSRPNHRHPQILARPAIALLLATWTSQAADIAPRPAPTPFASAFTNFTSEPAALPSSHLQHVFRAAPGVFSGDAPATDAAFTEIANLGVGTIISVDGSPPNVETAGKHGLRYIHLPIGYDGVPPERAAELVKAAQSARRPIYVHCHRGLHRGPAAVAVICQSTANWSTNQAVTWLQTTGTSPDYPGLYRSVMTLGRPDAAALSRVSQLPERASTSSLVDAMVAIDAELDRLRAAQKSGWPATLAGRPELTPAHGATLLWENLRELARAEDTGKRSPHYRTRLTESIEAAARLRTALQSPAGAIATRDAALQDLSRTCTACHRQFRNEP